MLKIFKLYREGFNKSVKIGESFEHKEDKYVIINILKYSKLYSQTVKLRVDVIAQKVGSESPYHKYENTSTFEVRYIKGEVSSENPRYEVGEAFSTEGLAGFITCIESMRYEFVDLIVTYKSSLVRPWSKEEIEKALKEERLSSFKVITRN